MTAAFVFNHCMLVQPLFRVRSTDIEKAREEQQAGGAMFDLFWMVYPHCLSKKKKKDNCILLHIVWNIQVRHCMRPSAMLFSCIFWMNLHLVSTV